MGFILASLKRGLPLAAVVCGVFLPAQAQDAGGSLQGQPIVFSSPVSDNVDTNDLPSLAPKSSRSLDLEGIAAAPQNFNNVMLPGASLPLPPGPGWFGETAQQQDRRRNWTLLTPAEILGAATPEKIMGIPERDAFGQAKNLTALERYAARQNKLQLQLAKTNALQAGDSSSDWSFSGDSRGMSNSFSAGWRNPQNQDSPWFNATSDRQSLDRQNDNSAWSRLFSQPVTLPAARLEQQADMDRFRQILNPGLPSVTPVATYSSDGIKTSLPQTLLGSSLDRPPPNRIGASFAPSSSGISKLPELPKMPTAWSVGYTSAPPAAAWAPQQAPWLSVEPQPLAVPQRKF